jgi:hypothetical protein
MTLYEIADQYQQMLAEMEANDLPEDVIQNTLECVQDSADEKVNAIACIIKNLTGDIKAIKEEVNNLNARMRYKQNNIDRLERYLTNYLPLVGYAEKPFENGKHRISFRKSTQVDVLPGFIEWAETNHADELLRYTAPEPNKKAIKDAISAGKDVDFVRIVENRNLQIK